MAVSDRGVVIALPMLVLIVLPDVVAYLAIHLSYDTTWYVITDRSMRLRSGVWTMHEMTLTFENVQNVEIHQGPVGAALRYRDFAGGDGGRGRGAHAARAGERGGSNVGMLVGLENAAEVREWVMSRVRASRSSGLGAARVRGRPARGAGGRGRACFWRGGFGAAADSGFAAGVGVTMGSFGPLPANQRVGRGRAVRCLRPCCVPSASPRPVLDATYHLDPVRHAVRSRACLVFRWACSRRLSDSR